MKPVLRFLFVSLIAALLLFIRSAGSTAQEGPSITPSEVDENDATVTVKFTGLSSGEDYTICFATDLIKCRKSFGGGYRQKFTADGNEKEVTVCGAGPDDQANTKQSCGAADYFHPKTYKLYLFEDDKEDEKYIIQTAEFKIGHYYPDVELNTDNPDPDTEIEVSISGIRRPTCGLHDDSARNTYDFDVRPLGGTTYDPDDPKNLDLCEDDEIHDPGTRSLGKFPSGSYLINVKCDEHDFVLYSFRCTIDTGGGQCSKTKNIGDGGDGDLIPGPWKTPKQFGGETALGKLATDAAGFAKDFLRIALGVAGGVAFLLMVFGSYRLIFAGGNPEAIEQGKQVITAAIAGLIVIVFSVFILELIGVTIFGLNIGL